MSMTIENVPFDQLSANNQLLSDFAEVLKKSIAASAGAGVEAEDVELTLSSGSSVAVEAKVAPADGVSASDVQASLAEAAASGTAAQDVVDGITQLSGMDQIATGTISVNSMSQPAMVSDASMAGPVISTAATGAATTTGAAEEAATAADAEVVDECHPTCLQDRGICVDKICFCKNPYEGVRCEKTLESGGVRLSHALAVAVYCVAVILGVGVASTVFRMFAATQRDGAPLNAYEAQKEVWRPSAADPSRRK